MEAAVPSRRAAFWLALIAVTGLLASPLSAQLVPGTGTRLDRVGDDFEDPAWDYIFNLPKSSNNLDEQIRGPGGRSRNGRWEESGLRGQPDVIRRVSTPPDGLPGSSGRLGVAVA